MKARTIILILLTILATTALDVLAQTHPGDALPESNLTTFPEYENPQAKAWCVTIVNEERGTRMIRRAIVTELSERDFEFIYSKPGIDNEIVRFSGNASRSNPMLLELAQIGHERVSRAGLVLVDKYHLKGKHLSRSSPSRNARQTFTIMELFVTDNCQ